MVDFLSIINSKWFIIVIALGQGVDLYGSQPGNVFLFSVTTQTKNLALTYQANLSVWISFTGVSSDVNDIMF